MDTCFTKLKCSNLKIIRQLPNLVARSRSAEISEKVQPPRNMTSLHFDPGDSPVLESKENENKF